MQTTPLYAFTRKHFLGGATTHIRIANVWVQLTTHLSTPREWIAELAMLADIQRTVHPEEVTRQLHIMAQARESSPVIDWRSSRYDTPPTKLLYDDDDDDDDDDAVRSQFVKTIVRTWLQLPIFWLCAEKRQKSNKLLSNRRRYCGLTSTVYLTL